METKKTKKKILGRVLLILLLLLFIGWWVLCVKIYDSTFNIRCESYKPFILRVEDFDGLECKEYSFESDKGQKLAGYLYSNGENQHGIVVLAHGFGGGQNSYMDIANYLAKNGYYVFAYDATGCDKSEGDGVGGVPQGVIDLEHAISFVEDSNDIPELPIVLFGHSWGAYSVSAVLNYHPEVKAIVECAGFDKASDMFESGGKDQAGALMYAMVPFVKIHELVHFGKYASKTAMDGFDSTDAAIMVVHSTDDDVIRVEYGCDKYYEKYKDDPRFTFVRFEDRGHNGLLIDPDNTYWDELDAEVTAWRDTLDYDYKADENKERFKEDKANFIIEHIDHARYSDRVDEKMLDTILEFYDKAI